MLLYGLGFASRRWYLVLCVCKQAKWFGFVDSGMVDSKELSAVLEIKASKAGGMTMQLLKRIVSSSSLITVRRIVSSIGIVVVSLALAACGGGNDVLRSCKQGLIAGFGAEVSDATIQLVEPQEGESGAEGDGSVGDGEGIGIGGADGQYTNVDVSVEMANGRKFGPWQVDSTKGMVTYVHCGDSLPAKITFEGKASDAVYYDEGLKRDVPFAGKTRIGLMTDYEKNVGITPLTHALYERAMEIGRGRGLAEGWKNSSIVEQAHSELLAIVNDQFPSIYRLTELRRLPVSLNARNDREGSETLTANQNGVYGADIAGFSLSAATTLPDSVQPALDVAETLILDLIDGQLNLTDGQGRPLAERGRVPYTVDTLWSSVTVGAGETAVRNGRDQLAVQAVPIGHVRSRASPNSTNATTETLYVLGSNGELIASLNPSVDGGQSTQPAPNLQFSQLYRFGLEPVVALRRDGKGILVFPTSWDGSFSFEVAPPSAAVTMVEIFDAGYPVIRMSDGNLFRLQGSTLVPEQAPTDVLSYRCREEYDGALAGAADAALGLASGRVCYGMNVANELRIWRPGSVVAGRLLDIGSVKQVSGNEQVTLASLSDGSLFQLDNDHSVQFRNASGELVDQLAGGETRELISPTTAPLPISAPRLCWIRAPFVIACDGTAYQLEYQEYLDTQGRFQGAGPITGLKQLPIPAPVWRPLLNRKITAGDVRLGTDSVFVGTDGLVYDIDGRVLDLPLAGAPQQRPDQPPLAPTVFPVAVDDILDRREAQSPLVIQGTAQPGSTVTVTLGDRQQQAVSDGGGRWQVTFAPEQLPVADGPTPLEVVAVNPNGSSAPITRSVNVQRSLPSTPTINVVEGDDIVTAEESADGALITGSGQNGTTVQVTWGGQSKSTTVDSSGRWSVAFTASEVPSPADTQVMATASNLNGSSGAATRSVRVAPALPAAPQVAAVTGDNVITPDEAAAGVQVTGKGSPGSNVIIDWAGNTKSGVVDSQSNWSVFYQSNEVPPSGRSTLVARSSNAAGTTESQPLVVQVQSPPSIVLPAVPIINAVTGNNVIDPEEAATGVSISGSGTPASQIQVVWRDSVEKSAIVSADSKWSVFLESKDIGFPGRTTVTARASNAAGISESASIAIEIVPAAPTISLSSGGNLVNQEYLRQSRSRIGFSGSSGATQLQIDWLSAPGSGQVIATIRTSAAQDGLWSDAFLHPWTVGESEVRARNCLTFSADPLCSDFSSVRFTVTSNAFPQIDGMFIRTVGFTSGQVSRVFVPPGESFTSSETIDLVQIQTTDYIDGPIQAVRWRRNGTVVGTTEKIEIEGSTVIWNFDDTTAVSSGGTFSYTVSPIFSDGSEGPRSEATVFNVQLNRGPGGSLTLPTRKN